VDGCFCDDCKNEVRKMALGDYAIVHWFNGLLGKNKAEEDLKAVAEAHERVDEDNFRKTVEEKLGGIDHVANDLHVVSGLALEIKRQNEEESELIKSREKYVEEQLKTVERLIRETKTQLTQKEEMEILDKKIRQNALINEIKFEMKEIENIAPQFTKLWSDAENSYFGKDHQRTNVSLDDFLELKKLQNDKIRGFLTRFQGFVDCLERAYYAQTEYVVYLEENHLLINNRFSPGFRDGLVSKNQELEGNKPVGLDFKGDSPLSDEDAARIMRGERI
jgi:hypothetical protein